VDVRPVVGGRSLVGRTDPGDPAVLDDEGRIGQERLIRIVGEELPDASDDS
jgi:hypothetical protein